MDINIESVKELLDSRNIKKIIYVDNDFGIGSYENNSKEFVRCNASNEDFEWPFDYSADVDILLYNFNSWWVNASEDTREEFVLKNSIDLFYRFQVLLKVRCHLQFEQKQGLFPFC